MPKQNGTAYPEPKVAARRGGHRAPSPHLLDLKAAPAKKHERVSHPVAVPRWPLARLMQALDERIHLRDLRVRTLSVRTRGWKDFPPASATTMWQALRLTVARFFDEHPLADLTVLPFVHLLAVIFWKLAIRPIELLLGIGKGRVAPA